MNLQWVLRQLHDLLYVSSQFQRALKFFTISHLFFSISFPLKSSYFCSSCSLKTLFFPSILISEILNPYLFPSNFKSYSIFHEITKPLNVIVILLSHLRIARYNSSQTYDVQIMFSLVRVLSSSSIL